jgi:hypothetical protein
MKIRVGKPDASQDTPGHTKGIRQGNTGPFYKQRGHLRDGRVTSERSTGVNPDAHNPIDPSMPNLPPA